MSSNGIFLCISFTFCIQSQRDEVICPFLYNRTHLSIEFPTKSGKNLGQGLCIWNEILIAIIFKMYLKKKSILECENKRKNS